MAALPSDSSRYSMKWDGEWQITYEVFRDLGIAFAAVLILIYGLVVGWFQSFMTPLVIMAAIPFSLVGILPAHGLLHAFFTATSMIGFIAGAGIVVRNSIILVDFIELRLAEGMPLDAAVIDAGAVRFRPMMLTAAAVVVGSSVILFDPIFQGLAIALMAGEIASLLLSRMTVPVLFYLFNKEKEKACMNVDRYLRMIAGAFVLLTLALGYWVNPYWYLFTAFVGLNLFQSAFTNWCPMMTVLRKLGVQAHESLVFNDYAERQKGWYAPTLATQFKNGRRFHCLIPGAAFREQETEQGLQAGGVCRIPKKFLIPPHLNQPLVPQLVEVMRERGRRDIELRLNIAYDHALRVGSNQ